MISSKLPFGALQGAITWAGKWWASGGQVVGSYSICSKCIVVLAWEEAEGQDLGNGPLRGAVGQALQ